ncbi:MAG: ABC transporter permease [Bacilli bacterium]|nr:ABC transporter permease [Bacilli bacterium]
MSADQQKYLKKIKIEKFLILVIQIMIVLIFVFLWEYCSNHEIINSFIYSSPTKIIATLKELIVTNNLLPHILCTLKEVVISFLGGIFLGLIISLLLYEFKFLSKVCEPFLVTLNSLPKVALGPVIIIIAGANLKSIIMMALLINLIVTIMNFYNGFINIDDNKQLLMKTFNASKLQTLKYLVIPGSLNTIISSLKINISMTLIGVIMGEFLVSKQGVGYLIIYGTQIFNMNLVMAGIVILVIMSIILYKMVLLFEKKYCKN